MSSSKVKLLILIVISRLEILFYLLLSIFLYFANYHIKVDSGLYYERLFFKFKDSFIVSWSVIWLLFSSFLFLNFFIFLTKKYNKLNLSDSDFLFLISINIMILINYFKIILYFFILERFINFNTILFLNKTVLFFYLFFYFTIFHCGIYQLKLKKDLNILELFISIFIIFVILSFNNLNSFTNSDFLYYNFLESRMTWFIFLIIFASLVTFNFFKRNLFFSILFILIGALLGFYFSNIKIQILSEVIFFVGIFLYYNGEKYKKMK